MTAKHQFSPVLPQHAIERCAATIAFAPSLPDKAFGRLLDATAALLASQGFAPQQVFAFGWELGPGGARPLPDSVRVPQTFTSTDQSLVLTVMQEALTLASTAYLRWQPFVGSIEQHLLPIAEKYLETVSLGAVKLEYWDRFFWSGGWDDFNVVELIRQDSGLIAAGALCRPRQWHSHVGWFDAVPPFRRLTNVNVDVAEAVSNTAQLPSVGIYSALTDHFNISGYGATPETEMTTGLVIQRLEDQHLALKGVLGDIITDEMANRISLFSRTPRK